MNLLLSYSNILVSKAIPLQAWTGL